MPDEPQDVYDEVAEDYAVARPNYPSEVFEVIQQYSAFAAPPRVVEVGSGTGQATMAMAARGWTVHGVEPGTRLAERARRLAPDPSVSFQVAKFEDAELGDQPFDLVAAATSWHWVDPDVGYRKASSVLRRAGTIALFWNAHVPETSNPAWQPIRNAYLEAAPDLADLAPLTPDRPDYDPAAELRDSGYFESIEMQTFGFDVTYRIDDFLRLIGTYASHRALTANDRTSLRERLRAAAREHLGGMVTKPYVTQLLLGTRRD